MFSTLKQRLLLGAYVFILLSIPIGTYLVSEYRANVKSSAYEKKTAAKSGQTAKPTISPAKQLLKDSELDSDLDSDLDSSNSPSTTLPTSYGPTLSFKINLEGRPVNNQATRLFVGIVEGILSTNPKFLLSFNVDVPTSGQYSGLSLAGLNVGSSYTALLKGSAQIATASAFVMSPASTQLNGGQTINLISGDLNEDNVVNSTDYVLAQGALGSSPASSKWNENIDLNKDSIINSIDLGIIVKNNGRVGASGAWTSPIPNTSTSSAGLITPATGSFDNGGGYWIFIPK